MNKVPFIGDERKKWWSEQRRPYNKGLVISGIVAFVIYCIIGTTFIGTVEDMEVTLFSVALQCAGYLVMMGIANVLYTLGYVVDSVFNKSDSERFRERLFGLGFGFSMAVPLMIPVLHIIKFAFR